VARPAFMRHSQTERTAEKQGSLVGLLFGNPALRFAVVQPPWAEMRFIMKLTRIAPLATFLLAAAVLNSTAAQARSLCHVTNGKKSYGRLQVAIGDARSHDILAISGTCYGAFFIAKPLTLVGSPGAQLTGTATLTIKTGTVLVRDLRLVGAITNSGSLTLRRDVGAFTVTSSDSLRVVDSSLHGVENFGGSARIARSTVKGSSSYDVVNAGTMTVIESTITGATPPYDTDSGGIINDGSGSLYVLSSTIAGNTDTEGGGAGIEVVGGHVTIAATILSNDGVDCEGPLRSGGYNIVVHLGAGECQFQALSTDQVGVKPLLKAPSNNGGFTATKLPNAGSPAIDAIPVGAVGANNSRTPLCPALGSTDQRGVARPQGAACDIGAVEVQP
jgi:hypothetical protein